MSLRPFFFRPGYLTQRFIEGKRASFVNPIRLYLIISLLFFFVFNMVSRDAIKKSIARVDEVTENLSDSSKQAVDKVLTDLDKLEGDTVFNIVGIIPDSTNADYKMSFEPPDSTNRLFTTDNISTYQRLRKNYDLSVEQIIDSLNTSGLSTLEINLTRQLIRLDRAENEVVISQLLKNLPIMMLFTLPFFALLLKLLYVRRNQYYITHLVHALHLHSFAYVLYAFFFAGAMYWLPEGSATFYFVLTGFILVTTHSYLSFLNVYGQGWFKTLVKFNLIGFLYLWLLLFAVLIEMVFSVYTY